MSGVLERTLGILELLAAHPEGLALGAIAEKLNMPLSAAHRLLTELTQRGYAKQMREQGEYGLSTKLVAMVLDYMGSAGIVDFAQPVLDRLARETEEFVRLAVVDGEQLIWIARAQGARRGLRYDAQVDATARLSCTASGHAWLMSMSDDDALLLAVRQGFGRPQDYGPKAPTTPTQLLELLKQARMRGYAMTHDMFGAGLASMAIPNSTHKGCASRRAQHCRPEREAQRRAFCEPAAHSPSGRAGNCVGQCHLPAFCRAPSPVG